MILYSLPETGSSADSLRRKLPGAKSLTRGRCVFSRFSNGEWHAAIREKAHGQKCLVFGSFTPPDDQLLRTLILAHTLKKEGAERVIAMLPYLAYTRHDRQERHLSFITDLIGKIAAASGIDKIITIDIHSQAARLLMGMPVINLSPAELFLSKMTKADLSEATVVAPDEGAKERADDFRKAAGIDRPIAYFKKVRSRGRITRLELKGKISGNIILVDDVLDTGGTLISCARQLQKRGVKKMTVAVTHGLFTGESWKSLFELNITKIITTDSVSSALRTRDKRIKIVSCATLLAKALESDIR